jgi:hypothetical protein
VLKVKPDGSEGDIEKPFEFTGAPVLLTVAINMGLPAVMVCVPLESVIEGARLASIVVKVVVDDCLLGIDGLILYFTSK